MDRERSRLTICSTCRSSTSTVRATDMRSADAARRSGQRSSPADQRAPRGSRARGRHDRRGEARQARHRRAGPRVRRMPRDPAHCAATRSRPSSRATLRPRSSLRRRTPPRCATSRQAASDTRTLVKLCTDRRSLLSVRRDLDSEFASSVPCCPASRPPSQGRRAADRDRLPHKSSAAPPSPLKARLRTRGRLAEHNRLLAGERDGSQVSVLALQRPRLGLSVADGSVPPFRAIPHRSAMRGSASLALHVSV